MKSIRLPLSFSHELYLALTSFLLQVLFLFGEKVSQFQGDKTYQFPGCILCSWGKKSACLRFFPALPHVASLPLSHRNPALPS